MNKIILDSSSVLALLNQEVGREAVVKVLGRAVISTVNFSEVVAKLAQTGAPKEVILQILGNLNLEIIPFDEVQSVNVI